MSEMKYLIVPPDWNGAAEKQNELMIYLQSGWEIVSATGTGEVVHYIIQKELPKNPESESRPAMEIVKKSPGRPKKVITE